MTWHNNKYYMYCSFFRNGDKISYLFLCLSPFQTFHTFLFSFNCVECLDVNLQCPSDTSWRKKKCYTTKFNLAKPHSIKAFLETLNPTIFNIICWVAGTNTSLTKHLMFQVLFFYNFLKI